jgi:polyphosphate kinase 2 (PPK2 family)
MLLAAIFQREFSITDNCESYRRWCDYSRVRDDMSTISDAEFAPRHVVVWKRQKACTPLSQIQ